jgi:large subunit ribosomal protein L14
LDIRNTDFEVFEARGKDNPLSVKVLGGSTKVYGHVGDVIVANVKTGNPSQSVKKPGKN